MEFNFYSDPGHGWCEVSADLIKSLGIAEKISAYSYFNNGMAYLEEDCDYSQLVKALIDKGVNFTLNEIYQENTPIRHYQRFNPALVH